MYRRSCDSPLARRERPFSGVTIRAFSVGINDVFTKQMLLTWLTCFLKGRKSCLHLARFNTAANANKSAAHARLYEGGKVKRAGKDDPAAGRGMLKGLRVDCEP